MIAESEGKDRGATFTVRLPVRSAERRRDDVSGASLDEVKGRLEGRDILVVDDDLDTRELLVSALEGAGGQRALGGVGRRSAGADSSSARRKP